MLVGSWELFPWGNVIIQITPQPFSRRRWQPQESLQSRVPCCFCASTRSLLGNQVGKSSRRQGQLEQSCCHDFAKLLGPSQ
jgi:hypothetical protein